MKINVKSVPTSFRRAGRTFTKNPITIDVDEETREILRSEPMLVVEDVKGKAEPSVPEGGDAGAETDAAGEQTGKKKGKK